MDNSVSSVGQFVDDNILLIVALCMFLLGVWLSFMIYSRPLQQARRETERLQVQLQTEEQLHEERLRMLEDAQDRLHHTFTSASQRALRENNQHFLQLAQESMRRFQSESQADLDQRKQSIHHLLDPIRQALEKTEQQIHSIEKERQTSFGVLGEQLRNLGQEQMALRQETHRLSTALRNPGMRGQWGEMSLRRIVEMAGMIAHCDFIEQVQRSNAERTIRPDMVIRMPDQRELIIDAKTPMDAYMDAAQAGSEIERKQHLQRYARSVREHVRLLASKRYWEQFKGAPDFVILFMPGEQFLGAALEQDHTLMQEALDARVILSTPATLMALLRAVAFGWQQAVLTENASKIRDVGAELHKRLSILTNHVERLGKHLDASVETYNRMLGSMERSVMPGARRLAELGIVSGRELADVAPLESSPRSPLQTELELPDYPLNEAVDETAVDETVIIASSGLASEVASVGADHAVESGSGLPDIGRIEALIDELQPKE